MAALSNQFRTNGVTVTVLPWLKAARRTANGQFAFDVVGDVGTYTVLRSSDSITWTPVGSVQVTDPNSASVSFIDASSQEQPVLLYQTE